MHPRPWIVVAVFVGGEWAHHFLHAHSHDPLFLSRPVGLPQGSDHLPEVEYPLEHWPQVSFASGVTSGVQPHLYRDDGGTLQPWVWPT